MRKNYVSISLKQITADKAELDKNNNQDTVSGRL
ncbi:MAG: hypothetical protein CM15mV8_1430 [Caudoviricetes sp.]|nr:MAG: hypothetical protein CM15mV8_1430 [Caudoviricetes sp.]